MKLIRALIGLFILVALVTLAFKLIPPYFNNYQFQDAVEGESRLSSYSPRSEQDIRDSLMKKAREYDIPIKAEQIHVERSGPELTIWCDYSVHVDMPGYSTDLKFRVESKNRKI